MKKLILSLMSAALSCTIFAANCVSVKQIGTDYASHQITIALTRTGCTGDATNHRNTVWVFVDYRETGGSSWTRATISAASAGTVVNSGSSKGAWITGTNGTQTVTLTLSGMSAKYDWCAFATDYPPNVAATGGVYTFKGTPPFVLQPATGAAQTVTQTTLAAAVLTVVPVSIMDATGCTGTFCPYSGSDLYIDAAHVCQQRTSGAKNWEAWIKDSRDSKYYRIVLMPDNKWWLAQPLAYAAGVYSTNNGILYYDGNPGCPTSWGLPSIADWKDLFNMYGGTYYSDLKTTTGWAGNYYAGNGNDKYGLSLAPTGIYSPGFSPCGAGWYSTTKAFSIGPSRIYSSSSQQYHQGMGYGFGVTEYLCSSTPSQPCSGGNCSFGSEDYCRGCNKDGYSRAPLRCFRTL